jgi:hypothetical protein
VLTSGPFAGAEAQLIGPPVPTNIGTFATGHLDTTFSAFAPAGTYFARVRAANAFAASAPSNEVTVVVP